MQMKMHLVFVTNIPKKVKINRRYLKIVKRNIRFFVCFNISRLYFVTVLLIKPGHGEFVILSSSSRAGERGARGKEKKRG